MLPRTAALVAFALAAAAALTAVPARAACCDCTSYTTNIYTLSASCSFSGTCECASSIDQDQCRDDCLNDYNIGDLDCAWGDSYSTREDWFCSGDDACAQTCFGAVCDDGEHTYCTSQTVACASSAATSCGTADPCDGVVCSGRNTHCDDGACVCDAGHHGHGGPSCHAAHTCTENCVWACDPDGHRSEKPDAYPANNCRGGQVETAAGSCSCAGCPGTQTDGDDDGICERPCTLTCPGGQELDRESCSCSCKASCSGSTPRQLSDCSCVECIEDRDCTEAGESCVSNACQPDDPWPDNGCPGSQVNRNGRCYNQCDSDDAQTASETGFCECPAGEQWGGGTCGSPSATSQWCSPCTVPPACTGRVLGAWSCTTTTEPTCDTEGSQSCTRTCTPGTPGTGDCDTSCDDVPTEKTPPIDETACTGATPHCVASVCVECAEDVDCDSAAGETCVSNVCTGPCTDRVVGAWTCSITTPATCEAPGEQTCARTCTPGTPGTGNCDTSCDDVPTGKTDPVAQLDGHSHDGHPCHHDGAGHCHADSDCGTGKACSGLGGSCSCTASCGGDTPRQLSDCSCVECVEDGDCTTAGESCVSNVCEPDDACAGVACSGSTPHCTGGVCVECTSNAHCGNGQECSSGTCRCPSNTHLHGNGGETCHSDGAHCHGDLDELGRMCSFGMVCNPATGGCHCGSGHRHDGGDCHGDAPGHCHADSDCGTGRTCGGLGGSCSCTASCGGGTPRQLTDCSCVECVEDGDCTTAGESCVSNVCEPDDACAGVACSGSTPHCTGGVCVECTSNVHCGSGQECTGGTCRCPSNTHLHDGHDCHGNAQGHCHVDSDCGVGKACSGLGGSCSCTTSCSGDTPRQLTDCSCVECVEDVDCTAAGESCSSNVCEPDDACDDDQVGTPPDCVDCGEGEVPDAAGDACEPCPEGQAEATPGRCTPVATDGGRGHCTRPGNYYPGDEVSCSRFGNVATNGRCERTACPAGSTDNGTGVCVCDPGLVYDNSQPGRHGTRWHFPILCSARTAALCGSAPDPGTCGEGGTWNSGTATCDCGEGYERSEDGQSCVCATDGDQQTGHAASVLFPNPQSLFDGARVGFVNTSSGNLTFRRRDIVTRAQGPVVFARVYDSRIAANADLGPGWRLSLAEEILVDGDAAVHVDASGARHAFARNGTAWATSPPTPRHAGTTLSFADAGGVRTAVLADGEAVRTFAQADASGARYVLSSLRTAARELAFGYADGRLASVSRDGDVLLRVERDAGGRIAAVRDGHGRSVRHFYDADGRLATVRDLAGGDWSYRYGDDGLLAAAVDPEGRTYLAAEHDDAGRAERVFADGRLHDYAYAADGATVTEDAVGTHALTRNAAGVTTALESTAGASWRATLDAANRVSTLTLPERTMNYAYGAHGRVASMTVADAVSGTTRMHSYGYDAQGRLVSATGGGADATVTYAAGLVRIEDGDGVFEYEVDDRGRVAWVRQGTEPEIRVERDGAGDVVEISQGGRSVRFGRDELGRIVDATFADGSSARYFYDDLGNRTLAEYGDGRGVQYAYDASGNLTSVETTERDGTLRLEVARTNLFEKVAPLAEETFEAEYDRERRRVASLVGGRTVAVESAPNVAFADGRLLDNIGGRAPRAFVRTVFHGAGELGRHGDRFDGAPVGDFRAERVGVAMSGVRSAETLRQVAVSLLAHSVSQEFEERWKQWTHALEYAAVHAFSADQQSTGSSACSCAVPTSFRKTRARVTSRAVLRFNYAWSSSTGKLSDLANCKVREHVTYAGAPVGSFTWPTPFDVTVDNPTLAKNIAGTEGGFEDTHHLPYFRGIPQSASVSAEQYYQFSCPCHENGDWVDLAGPYSIDREVAPNSSGGWKYTITKDGLTGTLDPLQ